MTIPTPVETWCEETTGLCPSCLRTVPARISATDGQIWMEQTCPRHGASRALLASDASEYLRLRQYVPDRASGGGCCGPGEVCGPNGENPGPPTCVLLLEITQACNLRCPTCYANSNEPGRDREHDFMTLETVRERLDAFFRTQRTLDVLMLSGGEPTIHPRFREILDIALGYPIERVLINTNGLRINQSDDLVTLLHENRRRVELYFSFGSFNADVQTRLYGKDLTELKQKALHQMREAEVFVTLVPTIERGINDNEIGDLFRYALTLNNINGVTYQPVMDNGRYLHGYRPEDRITLTGVIAALEAQTNGLLRSSDFVGLPCSHPDCCALTYGFLNAERTTMTPLPRHLDVSRYMELFSDRITFSDMVGSALRRVWSDVSHLRGGQTLKDFTLIFRESNIREALPLLGDPLRMGKRIFRVVVKPFMDAQTYDHNRVHECCTKILNERGEAVSFCEYNVFHRGRPATTAKARPLMMVR